LKNVKDGERNKSGSKGIDVIMMETREKGGKKAASIIGGRGEGLKAFSRHVALERASTEKVEGM